MDTFREEEEKKCGKEEDFLFNRKSVFCDHYSHGNIFLFHEFLYNLEVRFRDLMSIFDFNRNN